jgi:hypothetical protein
MTMTIPSAVWIALAGAVVGVVAGEAREWLQIGRQSRKALNRL